MNQYINMITKPPQPGEDNSSKITHYTSTSLAWEVLKHKYNILWHYNSNPQTTWFLSNKYITCKDLKEVKS